MKDYFEKTREESLLYYRGLKEKKDGMVHVDEIIGEYDAVNMEALCLLCMVEERASDAYEKNNVKEDFDCFVRRLREEVFEMRTGKMFQ